MRRFTFCTLVMVLVSLVGAQSLEAQDRKGMGAFLDWFHRLSGPRMVGPAVTGWHSLGEVPQLRMSVGRLWSVKADSPLPADKSINMWSFRPAIEFRLADPLAVGGGVSINRFDGDFDESFTHLSYPVYAQLRFPTGARFQGVISGGGQYFPEFDASAFDPIETGVSKDGGELTFWFGVGFEFVWY